MESRYLFKAKRIDNGEWVKGCYRTNGMNNHFITVFQNSDGHFTFDEFEIEEGTLCQCTGLKDKNGELIWENDIVECGIKLAVTWNKKFASWCLTKKRWMHKHFFGEACEPEDCEVLGSSIDNPELLEVD